MNCKKCTAPMIPINARTISGLGQQPKMVRVMYECSSCSERGYVDKPEIELTREEISVRRRI